MGWPSPSAGVRVGPDIARHKAVASQHVCSPLVLHIISNWFGASYQEFTLSGSVLGELVLLKSMNFESVLVFLEIYLFIFFMCISHV